MGRKFAELGPRGHTDAMATKEATTVSGNSHGVSRHRAFDRWLRYPAGLSELALDAAFEVLGDVQPPGVIVDPFCGVGTVGTAARTKGLGFVGIETHPWIAHAASLKFSVPDDVRNLRTAAAEVTTDLPPREGNREHELVQRAFDPATLGVLVALRERIRDVGGPWREHLELALLSNLRAHATVKVGWPYQLPSQPRAARSTDPVKLLLRRVSMMAEDLDARRPDDPPATVVCGDSREAAAWKAADLTSAIGAVSSPPYLNNFDYADATRLELYFSGRVSSWKELCLDVRAGMVVATTQQTSVAQGAQALDDLARWPGVHAHVTRIVELLERERLRRTRGKEYSRVIAPYFRGVGAVLQHLAENLPTGAPVALVVGDSAPYGVYIDTPGILLAAGAEVGLTPVGARAMRSRGLKWRTNGSRHQVPLSEQLVEFRVAD